MNLRIGGVPYGVGAPLVAGMDRDPAVDLVSAPPTELTERLRRGELDAALSSSIEAISRPGYRVAPEIGIACKREIRSVRAFRRRGAPIATIGVDSSSATSVALLRLLLQNVHHGEVAADVRFEPVAPTRAPAALPHDVVMLIGDCGLDAAAGGREVWDLGAEWVQWTGLPFVFAVWVVREDVPAERLLPVLREARERGRELGAVDGTHGAAHYDLDDEDWRGLRRFWSECRAAGLAECNDPATLGRE